MDGQLEFGSDAGAEALAKLQAFLDATPELGLVWAQDAGDTVVRELKRRFAATKRGRETQPLRTFAAWCAAQPDPDNLLPEDHAVFRWASSMGLPEYYLFLAWKWFLRKYTQGNGKTKKYRDWLAVFDESVRERYGRLWYLDGDTYKLTADGQILARQFPDDERA